MFVFVLFIYNFTELLLSSGAFQLGLSDFKASTLTTRPPPFGLDISAINKTKLNDNYQRKSRTRFIKYHVTSSGNYSSFVVNWKQP